MVKKIAGQRDGRATDRRDAQPDRSARTNRTRAKDRYREHREVDDSIENIRRVIDKLKCFLNSRADLARDGNHERDCADEDDRVNGRFVSRMQTREPVRQQSVPSRDHWQSRAAGDVNAGRRNRAHRHQQNSDGSDCAGNWKRMQAESQRLRHRTDQIDRIVADKREHRTRSENEHQRDHGRSDKDGAPDVARGRPRFPSQNRDVFKSAERADGEFA